MPLFACGAGVLVGWKEEVSRGERGGSDGPFFRREGAVRVDIVGCCACAGCST